jgi:hypothetical protein
MWMKQLREKAFRFSTGERKEKEKENYFHFSSTDFGYVIKRQNLLALLISFYTFAAYSL